MVAVELADVGTVIQYHTEIIRLVGDMHIKTLFIRNFRALDEINVEFDNRVNVIVGPNAIGKTTILEAIRLIKALLCPRTPNESMQSLIALGAASPHLPQQMIFTALARDPAAAVVIRARFALSVDEMDWIVKSVQIVARGIVQARMGHGFSSPAMLINFLGTSAGQKAMADAQEEVRSAIDVSKADQGQFSLELTVFPDIGPQSTGNQIWPSVLALLEQRHPPALASFSYFPADRALPQGEQPIQLGMADSQGQLESHSSQPQMKYARLKNTIFSAMIMSENGRQDLTREFERIFNGILRGRRLVGFGLNHIGLLSIQVEDTETGRKFEIDGMSSGEKGLILTFLLIERSVSNDGLILLDEPELHLNPAVCKDLLSFLVEGYAIRKNLQVIVCSHSPEILAGAFENKECSLYHIESERMLTKVRQQDQVVISDALRRLGTSESDGLLFRGTIFVEGSDDVSLLEEGFGVALRRYKIKDIGGRREIEKEIKKLQDGEKNGIVMPTRYFIFDRDDRKSELRSTGAIRVLQWERRCLENYLLDMDVIADLLMNKDIVREPLGTMGDVQKMLRQLAFEQLDDLVARKVYSTYDYVDAGIRAKEICGKSLDDISDIVVGRLIRIKTQLAGIDEEEWRVEFIQKCTEERQRMASIWEAKWMNECDGKRLFGDMCQKIKLSMAPRRFKIRVIDEMRLKRSENWRTIEGLLSDLLSANA